MNNAIAADSSHRKSTGCLVSFIENVLFITIGSLFKPGSSLPLGDGAREESEVVRLLKEVRAKCEVSL